MPFDIRPNIVCLLFKCGVAASVMKNCDPFVFGPAFAIDRMPAPECTRSLWNSSSNLALRPSYQFYRVTSVRKFVPVN